MSSPKRYSSGVTNVASDKTMGQFLAPDPTLVYGYFNDFFSYAATDWVLTTQETGSATEALLDDETGGVFASTNGTADTDHNNFQLSKDGGTNDSESFKFAVGKKAWFKTRLKTSDGDKVTIHVGLHIVNTDPVAAAPSDGVFFKVTTATGDISFVCTKNSISNIAAGLGTMGDDTFVILGYYWDGVDTFYVYLNDVEVATVDSGSLPDDEYLAVSFGMENGDISADSLELDYIGAWMER